MSKSNSFHTVDSILKNTFKNLNVDENIKVYSIWKSWEKIVGADLAKQTKPAFIRRDCLTIFVQNHVWMNELQYMKEELLRKINEFSEERKISKILFKIEKV